MKPLALACQQITCHRPAWNGAGPSSVHEVTASFAFGELCAITGPDGSGKGLLMNVLGLMEQPDCGAVAVGEYDASTLSLEEMRQLRNEAFGFLFNHPCLLPSFSVAENVAMPLFRICGGDAKGVRARTLEVLEFCGIAHLEGDLAGRLDFSQRRTVALARALAHDPDILLILSPSASEDLLHLARRVAVELNRCVIWAGGEEQLQHHAHRLIQMDRGRILSDYRQ